MRRGRFPSSDYPTRKKKVETRKKTKTLDAVWLVDLTYVWVKERWWLIFLDEYLRYIVHWELLWSMDRYAVVERALAIPGRECELTIQSDNGPALRSREFKRYLTYAEQHYWTMDSH